MAEASVSLGYPTSVLVRPESLAPHSSKAGIFQNLTDLGIHILQGSLDDHESLANAFKQVDIIISTLAISQHMDQLKIIRAIQEVGNIQQTTQELYRPPGNIISQSEVVSLWEKKTGTTLKRVFVSESELIKLSETLPHPDNVPVCVLHVVFVKGDQTNYEVGEEELEVSKLYPDYKYTPIEEFLDASVSAPRNIKPTSLA